MKNKTKQKKSVYRLQQPISTLENVLGLISLNMEQALFLSWFLMDTAIPDHACAVAVLALLSRPAVHSRGSIHWQHADQTSSIVKLGRNHIDGVVFFVAVKPASSGLRLI